MKQLEVGIIGQGRSGRDIHGRHLLKETEKYKIVAVAEILKERQARAAEEYNCLVYENYREMLNKHQFDLIINSSPSHLHVPITYDIIKTGINVLCEKPVARKVSEMEYLLEAAEKHGVTFAVFQQSRFAPYYTQIEKVAASGCLGRLIQISISFSNFARRWDWQCLQSFNGGNLLNTGPHPLDQAVQFFGTDSFPNVFCFMDRVNTSGDAEDYVKVILSGAGRPVIDIEISSCKAYPAYTYNIQGSNGGLCGNMQHIEWKCYNIDKAPKQQLIRSPISNPDATPAFCSEVLEWKTESWDLPEEQKDIFGIMSKEYYDNLYDTIVYGKPLKITSAEILTQLYIIEECHRQNPLTRLFD